MESSSFGQLEKELEHASFHCSTSLELNLEIGSERLAFAIWFSLSTSVRCRFLAREFRENAGASLSLSLSSLTVADAVEVVRIKWVTSRLGARMFDVGAMTWGICLDRTCLGLDDLLGVTFGGGGGMEVISGETMPSLCFRFFCSSSSFCMASNLGFQNRIRLLTNQLFRRLISMPVSATMRAFSDSEGYGWLMCSGLINQFFR